MSQNVAVPPEAREALFLALVALFALCLRLGYNLLLVGPGYEPEYDAREYSEIAASLASGLGYRLANGAPTAIRPPLFPLLLAAAYRLGGVDYRLGLVVEALIGAGIVVATYAVGRQVDGVVTGRVAAVIAATYPLLIYAGGSLLSEPLFILLVTLAVVAALRLLERPSVRGDLWLGLLLGLAWLTRPNGVALVPCLLAWWLVASREAWPYRLADAAVVALMALAVATPWIARNYLVFGKLIPTSTMTGAVLLGSYNELVLNDPALRGDWVSPCEIPGVGWSCRLDELGRDAAWRELALAFMRGHVGDLPRMAWWRLVKFWHLYRFAHGFPANVGFYYYAVVALLAPAGAWLTRCAWRRSSVLWAIIGCSMVTAALSWGGFRMRAPAEPALIILASGTLSRGWRWIITHWHYKGDSQS